MAVTIDGLVTGIDTANIVEGLLKIQKQQIDRFAVRKAEIQQKQATFKGLETRLLGLQLDVSRVSRSQANPFTRQTVKVSDETLVSGTANESAPPGTYRFTVDSVARSHQVASQGFSDVDAEISQGTFEFRVGNGAVSSVTIDGTNNSLEGLANAINAADGGVSASILKDSSGGGSPYRLLLTSTESGADKEITVTNNLAPDSGTAQKPVIDFGNPVQAASDAQVTFGTGPGAITTVSSSNRFDNVIQGVSFDLLQAAPGSEVTLTVERNVDAAVQEVQTFVDSFNEVIQYIDDQSQYLPETDQSGPLQGNRNVQTIQQKLRSAVLDVVPGLGTSSNRLSTIGISITDKGKLQLDSTRLRDVLSGNDDNVNANDVKRLFALDGKSSNPGISWVSGTAKTKATGSEIQVDITQAAERASLTGVADLSATTIIDETNQELTAKIDGVETTITLAQGSYSQQDLATLLEDTINSSTELNGRQVSVSVTNNKLKIISDSYGSISGLEIVGGAALNSLGLEPGQEAAGLDVAGRFLIDGVEEVATGKGQILTGTDTNENTAELKLRVLLKASDISADPEADVTVSRGIGANLGKLLSDILSSDNGLASNANDAFKTQLTSIQDTIDKQQAVFDRQQAQLIKQFTTLETAISQLQSTSTFVAAQLVGLNQ
ncbi:MAG: flagellar filament capping protein FliD [Planctomycetaceae bacterium]|nr:flagellar filament capping protein FliD [Planctomycetaceae bacterium]